MKNNSTSTKLFYKGNVSIKVKINGKLYELKDCNEGLDYLFYMFAVFISGNYNSSTMVSSPAYLDLRKAELVPGSDPAAYEEPETFLRYLSNISGARYYQEAGKWYAEFTSALNADALLETINVDDQNQYYLYLMTGYDENNSSEKYHDLARLLMSNRVLAQLTPGIVATIVWTMELLNS